MSDNFLKVTNVAMILKVGRVTIWNKIKRGELKAIKVDRDYRIFEHDLMAYIAKCNKKEEDDVCGFWCLSVRPSNVGLYSGCEAHRERLTSHP